MGLVDYIQEQIGFYDRDMSSHVDFVELPICVFCNFAFHCLKGGQSCKFIKSVNLLISIVSSTDFFLYKGDASGKCYAILYYEVTGSFQS